MATSVGSTFEKNTTRYTVTLRDSNGAAPVLDSLVLTLKTASGTVINSRNDQNVLNANGVTYSGGVITWEMTQLDNAVVDGGEVSEVHVFTFEAIWSGGAGRKNWERQYTVNELDEVA